MKNAVTKGVTDTGHAIGTVATNPWVQGAVAAGLAATGVGAPAAAAIMAAQKGVGNLIKPGGNLKHLATGALQGAALGGTAGEAGTLLHHIPQVASVQGMLRSKLGMSPMDGGGVADAAAGGAGEAAEAAGAAGGQSVLGKINDFATDHLPGLKSIEGFMKDHGIGLGSAGDFLGGNGGMNALGLAQGINAAGLQNKADNFANDAMKGVQANYDQRAPLRVAGLQGMLKPQTNDLSSLSAHSGPYGQGMPAIAPARAFSAAGA